MIDDGDEIEFLDEDADIVQQCVQSQPVNEEPPAHVIQKPTPVIPPLLVERTNPNPYVRRRKRKKVDEDDSDYDPTDDKPQRGRKRRTNTPRQIHTPIRRKYEQSPIPVEVRKVLKRKPIEEMDRRNLTIRVPDFDDPLCLPVRAILKDENDTRRLRHWNNLCLEQFKSYDRPLRPRNGEATSSKRTIVIRNLFNKQTNKTETTFWSKISVDNKSGDTKSDVIQSVLPRYREKKILNSYKLGEVKRRRPVYSRSEVILTKEKDGQEEKLVAYKPDDALSMVFKMFESTSEQPEGAEEEKRYLEEMTSCKMCAPCYQTSWRGTGKNAKRQVGCPVCGRTCISIHNLVTHLKSHSADDIKRNQRKISHCLAKALSYHYTCRVCQKQFLSIGDLRHHVRTHKGSEAFYCEVGEHGVLA
ncbi:uncharacterized protein [Epargyreus clarus]|uniref:uncharacterized protein n=1 Tax=Epargyreus clarus TaxID=520877 RepID=UPI003C2E8708